MKKILILFLLAVSFGASAQNPLTGKPSLKLVFDAAQTKKWEWIVDTNNNLTINGTGGTPAITWTDYIGTGTSLSAFSSTGVFTRIANGTDGQFLSLSSGVPTWVASPSPSFGSSTQIPYMNVGGTDFLYSSDFSFSGTTLNVNQITSGDIDLSISSGGTLNRNISLNPSSGIVRGTSTPSTVRLGSTSFPFHSVAVGHSFRNIATSNQIILGDVSTSTITVTPTANRTITIPDATGTLALTSDLSAYTPTSRTLTIAGTANQITSSAGAQDLSSDRTWTLSFPSAVIFPGTVAGAFNGTIGATTPATGAFTTGAFSGNVTVTAVTPVIQASGANADSAPRASLKTPGQEWLLVTRGSVSNQFQIIDETNASTVRLALSHTSGNLNITTGALQLAGTERISNAGVFTGTGLTSSGSITFSGLTANRLVATTTGGLLTNTITSANLASSISDETGTGVAVFGTAPTFTTSISTPSVITASGDLTLDPNGTTNQVVLTDGQLEFPATQNASSNVNTLDDYEEGTWTPEYAATTGAFSSITYDGATAGMYVKIGKQVTVWGRIVTSEVTLGTAGGELRITGLPFSAPSAKFFPGSLGSVKNFSTQYPSSLQVVTNIISLLRRTAVDGGSSTVSPSSLTTGTVSAGNDMYFSATFFVD